MILWNKICYLIRAKGLIGFANYLMFRSVCQLIAIPITLMILFISPFVRIRFIKLFSSRIGHYSFNTEAILCGRDLNIDKSKWDKTFFYHLPGEPICNTQLHAMWKRTIPLLNFSSIILAVDKLLLRNKRYAQDTLKKTFEPGGDGRDRWALLSRVSKCHLSFTDEEHNNAKELMEQMGLPANARFICLLARDSHYLNAYLPSGNWSYHDYRDADINSYQLSAKSLVEKGYYVIRMGKIVKDTFDFKHPKVIDYAVSKFRSDFLDIYLSAHCFFFHSTCTGLDSVARMFRKPLLVTNLGLPDFDIWHPWMLFIPKKILDVKNNQLLSFKEMSQLYPLMTNKRAIMPFLEEQGLRFIDNSPEEIKDVTEEMLARLEGNWQENVDDRLSQQTFWDIFPKYVMPDDASNLALPLNETIAMKVGASFLKKNHRLLPPQSARLKAAYVE